MEKVVLKGITVPIEKTKKGYPALWESGGGYTNTGFAVLIADKYLNPKKPLYIRTSGELACANHALIPIAIGDCVGRFFKDREGLEVHLFRITDISNNEAFLEPCDDFTLNMDVAFVQAGFEKLSDYHCRTPYFIKEMN